MGTEFNEFFEEAQRIEATYQRDRDAALNDKLLSDDGKQKYLDMAETTRKNAVADLQRRAEGTLGLAQQEAQRNAKQAAQAELQRRRDLLGDDVVIDLTRRELAQMDSAEIVAAFEDAADDWQREIIRSYGEVELRGRIRSHDSGGEMADHMALRELEQGEPDAIKAARQRLAELRDVEHELARLDADAYSRGMADRVGVSAASVRETMWG